VIDHDTACAGETSAGVQVGPDDRQGRYTIIHLIAKLGEDLAVVMAARDTALAGTRAASTLVTVPALARPQWKLEITVVAAR
jgi:hypothetical protein